MCNFPKSTLKNHLQYLFTCTHPHSRRRSKSTWHGGLGSWYNVCHFCLHLFHKKRSTEVGGWSKIVSTWLLNASCVAGLALSQQEFSVDPISSFCELQENISKNPNIDSAHDSVVCHKINWDTQMVVLRLTYTKSLQMQFLFIKAYSHNFFTSLNVMKESLIL